MSSNQNWHHHFALEQDFYNELKHLSLVTTIDNHTPEFIKVAGSGGKEIPTPPTYIRQIYRATPKQLMHLKLWWAEIQENWIELMLADGKTAKRLPPRFPQFIENVENINVTIHPAYSSVLLDGIGHTPICRYFHNQMEVAMREKALLKEIGIQALIKDTEVTSSPSKKNQPSIFLMASQTDVIDYFTTKHNKPMEIRARRESGSAHRATVKLEGAADRGTRYNLGLLICTGQFSVVSHQKSFRTRIHKTEIKKDELTFDCLLTGKYVNFFDDGED
ncbi:MAG: hypothetical protein ACK5NC_06515 [Vibrio sp.]